MSAVTATISEWLDESPNLDLGSGIFSFAPPTSEREREAVLAGKGLAFCEFCVASYPHMCMIVAALLRMRDESQDDGEAYLATRDEFIQFPRLWAFPTPASLLPESVRAKGTANVREYGLPTNGGYEEVVPTSASMSPGGTKAFDSKNFFGIKCFRHTSSRPSLRRRRHRPFLLMPRRRPLTP